MIQTPMNSQIVREKIAEMALPSVGLASIREINRIVDHIELATGEKFIRMEMGIPGLEPPQIAVDAEIEALKRGVGSKYPPFDGVAPLKSEIALFIKNFLDVSVTAENCFPTVGSMQGCYMAMMVSARRKTGKNKILFIDPGFPVNKRQASVIGIPYDSFDIYEHRGEKLRPKLEQHLRSGDVAAIMYSNPNNPSWICFTETELRIIAEMAEHHDAIVLEDLAYFGMDFRIDYSQPGLPPYIPSVAKYTDRFILLISSSKSFSLAGQRIGMTAISPSLFKESYPDLKPWFGSPIFGRAYIFGAMYALSSGVSHSNQYGLLALLQAVNQGRFNFVESVKVYGERAKVMKKLFTDNGFVLVYDSDEGRPLADGFYFTIAYPGLSGEELVEEFLYYGISAIALSTTGSDRHEGLRACVSMTSKERFPVLEQRLRLFHEHHRQGFRATQS